MHNISLSCFSLIDVYEPCNCELLDLRQCVASADRLRAASARSAWALICFGFGYWVELIGMWHASRTSPEHLELIKTIRNLHLISRPFFILPPAWNFALQCQLRVIVLETGHYIHFLWHSTNAASRLPMSWGNLEMCLQLEPCGSFCWMIHGRMVGKLARVGRLKPSLRVISERMFLQNLFKKTICIHLPRCNSPFTKVGVDICGPRIVMAMYLHTKIEAQFSTI